MEVDKELFRNWIDALKSGKYKQGRYSLVNLELDDTKTFCCLGVLNEISGENVDGLQINYLPDISKFQFLRKIKIREIVNTINPEWSIEGYLSYLNDTCNLDFEDIATWLEVHFDKIVNVAINKER